MVKGKKLILTKTRYEMAAIQPGEITELQTVGKTYIDEPRLLLLNNLFAQKVKGISRI